MKDINGKSGTSCSSTTSCSANLEEEYVSPNPSSWAVEKETEKEMAQQIELVQGARLRGNDLRWAKARRAFLAKADLRQANLEGADLFIAQLQGANLSGANLQGANLASAYLQRADLSGADLQKADLTEADLRDATGLTATQVKTAANWELAFYSTEVLLALGLPTNYNENWPAKFQQDKRSHTSSAGTARIGKG